MRKSPKKKPRFSWKAVVTGLGIVGSLILVGETTYKVWAWINRPLLEASYFSIAGGCLDQFMTAAKVVSYDSLSKSEFGPKMGLNTELESEYSGVDVHGATVASAVFLALKNVSDRQISHLDVVTPDGTSSAPHFASQDRVLVCVRYTYKTREQRNASIAKIRFQTGDGLEHAIVVAPPDEATFSRVFPTNDCLMFGSVPTHAATQ